MNPETAIIKQLETEIENNKKMAKHILDNVIMIHKTESEKNIKDDSPNEDLYGDNLQEKKIIKKIVKIEENDDIDLPVIKKIIKKKKNDDHPVIKKITKRKKDNDKPNE